MIILTATITLAVFPTTAVIFTVILTITVAIAALTTKYHRPPEP